MESNSSTRYTPRVLLMLSKTGRSFAGHPAFSMPFFWVVHVARGCWYDRAVRKKDRNGLLLGVGLLLVAGGAAVLSSNSPRHRARAIRQQADRELLDGARAIALHHPNFEIRALAKFGADAFERFWVRRHSGERPPPGLPAKIYGNWCGAGGSGPVVDELDALCRNHDLAYRYADDVENGRA